MSALRRHPLLSSAVTMFVVTSACLIVIRELLADRIGTTSTAGIAEATVGLLGLTAGAALAGFLVAAWDMTRGGLPGTVIASAISAALVGLSIAVVVSGGAGERALAGVSAATVAVTLSAVGALFGALLRPLFGALLRPRQLVR